MQKETLEKISEKLSVNRENYMESLRHNLDMCLSKTRLTIKSLAERADIPFSTLNNILYSNLSDCKVSTAVRLARALHISVDELIGCGTLTDRERGVLKNIRGLPEHSRYLVEWFIQHQTKLQNSRHRKPGKTIPVMNLKKDAAGNLCLTNDFDKLDISHVSGIIRHQIYLGIRLGCSRYMPHYSPYDILLIANDRPPLTHENSVLIFDEKLFITIRRIPGEDTRQTPKYYSIRDGKFRVSENNVDEILGYVAGIYQDGDGSQT